MEQQKLLTLLDSASRVSLILALAFLALTVFLFFFLDIRGTVLDLSGKARRNEMKRMQENYHLTGVLRTGPEPPPAETADTEGLYLTGRLPEVRDGAAAPDTGQMTGRSGMLRRREQGNFRLNKEVIYTFTDETVDPKEE